MFLEFSFYDIQNQLIRLLDFNFMQLKMNEILASPAEALPNQKF
jgi:hypothetical protein